MPHTIFIPSYNFDTILINEMAGNKLFCTFIKEDDLSSTIETLNRKYYIIHNKIFVLKSPDTEELILTYNIDVINTTSKNAIPNTILLHRKKESNTLYTINALNSLIKELNQGILDINYKINWPDFTNTILLTNDGSLKKIKTQIFKIIDT